MVVRTEHTERRHSQDENVSLFAPPAARSRRQRRLAAEALIASEALAETWAVSDTRAIGARYGLFCVGLSHAREDAARAELGPRKLFHLLRCT